MGTLLNYKCTNCSGYFPNQIAEISRGMFTTMRSCVCNDCTKVFTITGITEDNFDSIKDEWRCDSCQNKNFKVWDTTCPYCKAKTRPISIGDMWD